MRTFHVEAVVYAESRDDLHAVRNAVFVQEQHVPAALEHDSADPRSLHVLARDAQGRPIGAARLVPVSVATNANAEASERVAIAGMKHATLPRIGRMAVLRPWRGRGVGEAMLAALERLAQDHGGQALELHAQASAVGFYMRQGYLPVGDRFSEAGIAHQRMQRRLQGASAIRTREAAVAIVVALAYRTRRCLRICCPAREPGLFCAPEALAALRRLAVRGHGVQIRFLLQDAALLQREHAPLLALAQRLPSVFALRKMDDPEDRASASLCVVNDGGGYWFRPQGDRIEGEADLHAPGRSQRLRENFDRAWERAHPCTELRALGL